MVWGCDIFEASFLQWNPDLWVYRQIFYIFRIYWHGFFKNSFNGELFRHFRIDGYDFRYFYNLNGTACTLETQLTPLPPSLGYYGTQKSPKPD